MKNDVGIALAFALLSSTLSAASVHGRVLDRDKHPLGAVIVDLRLTPDGKRLETKSGADGSYRFDKLPAGNYALHTALTGVTAFALLAEERKELDLVIQPAEFFDEPKFTVAGVTSGTYQGGHGSDVILRSDDALTKETVSLSSGAPDNGGENEKSGAYVEAAREYQRAAELSPTEPNLFNWGAELLKHRADLEAIEVFAKGTRLYPTSVRILLGLATAYYAHGSYEDAARYFFAASDIDPADITPYLFLGKAQSGIVTQSQGFAQRMERFARLHPGDARANYYYASALWNRRKGPEDSSTPARVRRLLEKAVATDPDLSEAQLLLGAVYADRKDYSKAIAAFEKSGSEEAHYRLAQLYRLTGDTAKAREQIAIYEKMSKASADRAQRERSELPRFVFSLRTQ